MRMVVEGSKREHLGSRTVTWEIEQGIWGAIRPSEISELQEKEEVS